MRKSATSLRTCEILRRRSHCKWFHWEKSWLDRPLVPSLSLTGPQAGSPPLLTSDIHQGSFMAMWPLQVHRAPHLVKRFIVTVLTFSICLNKEFCIFCFAVGPANWVACPAPPISALLAPLPFLTMPNASLFCFVWCLFIQLCQS